MSGVLTHGGAGVPDHTIHTMGVNALIGRSKTDEKEKETKNKKTKQGKEKKQGRTQGRCPRKSTYMHILAPPDGRAGNRGTAGITRTPSARVLVSPQGRASSRAGPGKFKKSLDQLVVPESKEVAQKNRSMRAGQREPGASLGEPPAFSSGAI